MKLIYTLFAFSLALVSNEALAQEVSVDDAKTRALDFLSNQSIGPKQAKGLDVSSDLSLAYTSKVAEKTCFYVFNIGDDNGFIIAGGDEVAHEILGYFDHGSFDYNTAPDNLKWLLSEYAEQIAHPDFSTVAKAPYRTKTAKEERVSIEPMIQTSWEQGTPYNCEIPLSSGGQKFETGCVATAMAQVMKYWEYPSKGIGLYNYTNNEQDFSAFFGETYYDWDNMLPDYTGSYTDDQAKAVGTLMYHAGVSVKMDYGVSLSNADMRYIGFALINFFNYDESIRYDFRSYYTDEDWGALLYSELKAGRPVLYGGYGHEFICDGYDAESDMYYFRLGWGKGVDGYSRLSGTNFSIYLTSKALIYRNVMPANDGRRDAHLTQEKNSGYIIYDSEKCDSNASLTRTCEDENKECTLWKFHTKFQNHSCLSKTFDLGVKATETVTGKTHYWLSRSEITIGHFGSLQTVNLDFNPYDLVEEGTYELRPVARVYGRTAEEDWTEIDIYPTDIIPTITIEYGKTDIPFSTESETMLVRRILKIDHGNYYTGEITYLSSNPDVATVSADGKIKGVAVGSATITAHGVGNADYNETNKTFDITVTELNKTDFDFSIKDYVFLDNDAFEYDPDFDFRKYHLATGETLQVDWPEECDGELTFVSSDESVATVDAKGMIKGVSPGTVSITARSVGGDIFNDVEKSFSITVYSKSFELTFRPQFNYNNNPYEGYYDLYFDLKNLGEMASKAIIYYSIANEDVNGMIESNYTVPAGEERCFYQNIAYQNWKLTALTPNQTYTMKLYKDKDMTEPFNYPSVTFTYRAPLWSELYDYSLSESGFGTLILPCDAEVPDGMKVYSCSEIDENGVLMLVEESSIWDNTPYIVSGTYGDDYDFDGPVIIDEDNPTFTSGILTGVLGDYVALNPYTDYILQDQDGKTAFYQYTGTESSESEENDEWGRRLATKYRAFIRIDKDSRNAPKLNFPGMSEDETESIEFVRIFKDLPSGIYSIDGKRQTELQKGMNVLILEDGTAQKVFVK